MKKNFFNLLMISSFLTIVLFLLDGDVKEPNVSLRFIEFGAMNGILFLLTSGIYFSSKGIYSRFQKN